MPLRPVTGWVRSDRMLGRRVLRPHLFDGGRWFVAGAHRAFERAGEVVNRGEVVDETLHVRRQSFVRRVHARPAGIATDRRQLHRAQHRAECRRLFARRVAVPGVGAEADRIGHIDHRDIGIVGIGGRVAVLFDRPEVRGEAHVGLGREIVLVAEEQHEMVGKSLLDRRHAATGSSTASRDGRRRGSPRRCWW